MTDFTDLLEANRSFAQHYDGPRPGGAAKGVLIITCMDSRLDPLPMVGLEVGDAKVMRTPGGRVTPDVVAGTVVAVHLLGVDRIAVVQHTQCAMASGTDAQLADKVLQATGADLRGMTIGANPDQANALRFDVESLRANPHIASRASVAGFTYDLATGLLTEQD